MVLIGPISTPDNAPMKAATAKLILPASVVEIPMRRAPRRLTAVARKALPYSVRSENNHKATSSASAARITTTVCALKVTAPDDQQHQYAGIGQRFIHHLIHQRAECSDQQQRQCHLHRQRKLLRCCPRH